MPSASSAHVGGTVSRTDVSAIKEARRRNRLGRSSMTGSFFKAQSQALHRFIARIQHACVNQDLNAGSRIDARKCPPTQGCGLYNLPVGLEPGFRDGP